MVLSSKEVEMKQFYVGVDLLCWKQKHLYVNAFCYKSF